MENNEVKTDYKYEASWKRLGSANKMDEIKVKARDNDKVTVIADLLFLKNQIEQISPKEVK